MRLKCLWPLTRVLWSAATVMVSQVQGDREQTDLLSREAQQKKKEKKSMLSVFKIQILATALNYVKVAVSCETASPDILLSPFFILHTSVKSWVMKATKRLRPAVESAAHRIYLLKFETRLSCSLNCKPWLVSEPEPSLHYPAPESTDTQFLFKWASGTQAIGLNLFRCVQISNTTNQNPADRRVCHFWCSPPFTLLSCRSTQYLITLVRSIKPTHAYDNWQVGGFCMRGDIPQSRFNNILPPGLGRCRGVCVCVFEESHTLFICTALHLKCVNKSMKKWRKSALPPRSTRFN